MDPLRVAYDHDRLVHHGAPPELDATIDAELETMSIGVFARRARLSMKALRLYERLGLLTPDSVDQFTGYRRYRPAQLATARLVALLRRMDMPLAVVADVVGAPGPAGAELINTYWQTVERRIASQRELAAHLRLRLAGEEASFGELFEIQQRAVPEQLVLTEQRHVHIEQLASFIEAATIRLLKAAVRYGGALGPMFAVYHGEVNLDSDGPVEVCLPIPEQPPSPEAAMRREPAHREAYVRLRKAQVEYPQILSAFDAVAQWISTHALTSSAPPREVYFADFHAAAATDDVCDVAFPIADPAHH
jgi:DNA-binding transcriptional MerR regulator